MIKFFKKRWYLVLIVILIAGFIYYRNTQATAAANKENSYIVKRQNLKDTLTLSGQIDADEKAALKFQTSGRLAWVGVKEGDYVKKYQTIASLDQSDLKNRLTKYLNTYAVQRNTFEQGKDDNLNDQNALSQSIRDEAKRVLENNQYNLNNAVLDVEYQNLTLEYASLWTPIEGIVTNISMPFAGVNITPAGAEFDIVNPKTIYYSATADQTDIVNLKENMTGKINFDAYPDKTFTGKLYYISFVPKAGETGTVYELRFKLDNTAMKLPLKMGMTADLNIDLKEVDNTLSVPTAFIKKDSHGKYVTEKKDDKNIKIYVKTGDEINGSIIINSGLTEGDVIYD
jgi:RND family efflux transporter MFP subunit